jgi:hypothetical protein
MNSTLRELSNANGRIQYHWSGLNSSENFLRRRLNFQKEAPYSWERGRPVRTEREARKALLNFTAKEGFSVLRTLCGRDVRAPGNSLTEERRNSQNKGAFQIARISKGRMQSETEGANLFANEKTRLN